MEKIWVIEDDESIRGELQKLLRANGYQPVDPSFSFNTIIL